MNSRTRTYPTLLTGSGTQVFWGTGQSILELAAPLTGGHDAGVALFNSTATSQDSINLVGAASDTYESGDGLEAYMFLSPTNLANWSIPYFATDPEGSNGTITSPEGSVIFPYSNTPYIVVQWDPAYGDSNDVHLYLVSPAASGAVSRSTIQVQNVGSGSGTATSGNFVGLNLSYNIESDNLTGAVSDYETGAPLTTFGLNLSSVAFNPHYSPGQTYITGAGGSGNSPNGWGLLYMSTTGGRTSPVDYPVTFSESGLPSGSEWSVTLAGVTQTSASSSMVFSEPDGTYSYSVHSAGLFGPTPANGTVSVQNAGTFLSIGYQAVYPLTITQAGLPSGTDWAATVTGPACSAILIPTCSGAPPSLTRVSNGAASIVFYVSNGTYSYSAAAPGHANLTGTVSVDGKAAAPTTANFSPSSTYPSWLTTVVFAVVVIAIAVAAGIGLMRIRQKSPPPMARGWQPQTWQQPAGQSAPAQPPQWQGPQPPTPPPPSYPSGPTNPPPGR
jgi:hypothetical protein